jgi:hypothetical protein
MLCVEADISLSSAHKKSGGVPTESGTMTRERIESDSRHGPRVVNVPTRTASLWRTFERRLPTAYREVKAENMGGLVVRHPEKTPTVACGGSEVPSLGVVRGEKRLRMRQKQPVAG